MRESDDNSCLPMVITSYLMQNSRLKEYLSLSKNTFKARRSGCFLKCTLIKYIEIYEMSNKESRITILKEFSELQENRDRKLNKIWKTIMKKLKKMLDIETN